MPSLFAQRLQPVAAAAGSSPHAAPAPPRPARTPPARSAPRTGCCGCGDRAAAARWCPSMNASPRYSASLAQVPAARVAEPADFAVGQRQRRQQRVGGVEHGDARLRLRDQRQLVGDVARLRCRASPGAPGSRLVTMAMCGRDAGGGDIAGLVAGQLDRPGVGAGRPAIPAAAGRCCRHSAVRSPAARSRCASSAVVVLLPLVPVTQTALATSPVGIGALGEPQRGAADEARALLRGMHGFGLVRADAGRLHHHVECGQARARGVVLDGQQRIAQRRRFRCLGFAAEQRQRLLRQARTQRRTGGAAFAAPAPQRDAGRQSRCAAAQAAKCARRRSHSAAGCGARRPAPATARSPAPRHPAAAGSRGRSADQRVLAPLRTLRQRAIAARDSRPSPTHSNGLWSPIFQQRVEAGDLRRIVQQVAAEDADQPRLGHERRQRQEHEMALRADPAPAAGRDARRGCGSCGCSWRNARRSGPSWRTAAPPPAPTTAAAASSSAGRRRRATAGNRRTPTRTPSPWTTGG